MEQKFYKAALAFGFRGAGWLLTGVGSALFLAAMGVRRLADVAGRRAARITSGRNQQGLSLPESSRE